MTDRTAQFRALYLELRIADQRKFYDDRRREYEAAHRQAVFVRNGLLMLAAVVGALGQAGTGSVRALSGVLAAVLGALAAAVAAFESLTGFVPLTKLYGDAAVNLRTAEIDWEAGTEGDLAAGVDRVEEVFLAENGQWGQLAVQHGTESPTAAGVEGN